MKLLFPRNFTLGICLILLTFFIQGCKKEVVTTTPEPEQEVVIPGVNAGYGAEIMPSGDYEKLPLIAEPVMVNGRTLKDPVLTPTYDLTSKMPPVGNQGAQGSCTAWSTAFAARSYFNARLTKASYLGSDGKRNDASVFSPAFVYNQINSGKDKGAFTYQALDVIKNTGVCTLLDMPYKQGDYQTQPSNEQKQKAAVFKIKDWGRINITEKVFKKFLYYDYPVIIASVLDKNFLELKHKDAQNEFIWKENAGGQSGHSMVIVGYDDNRKAFKVQNSWGSNWANHGYIWLSYDIIDEVVKEAFIMIVDDKSIVAPPKVETVGAKLEANGSVVFSGRISDRGDAPVQGVGFCIATKRSIPDVKSSVRTEGVTYAPYNFTYSQQLAADTLWYRAYAETVSGTIYGDTAHIVINKGVSTGALGQNTLFFNDGKQAFAVNMEDGSLVWKSTKDASFNDIGSVYANGMYIFGEGVVGVDVLTGKTKWTYSDIRSLNSMHVVIGNAVFVTSEYRLTALDIKSGLKLWSLDAASLSPNGDMEFNSGSLSVTKDNKLFFSVWAGYNYKGFLVNDPQTGKSVSAFDNQGETISSNPFWDDNQLIMSTGASDLKSFSLKPTPKEIWRSQEFLSSTVISANVVVGYDYRAKALKGLDKSNGKKLWEYVPSLGEIESRMWSVSGKYLGCMVLEKTSAFGGNTFVHVIDITTGKLIWQKSLKTKVTGSVLAAGNKVLAWDDEAVAFDITNGKPLWSSNVNTSKLIFPRNMIVVNKDGTSYYMVESGMK